MTKKSFVFIIFALLLFLPVKAEDFHAGTPAGFYDDIDPNSVEETDNSADRPALREQSENKNSVYTETDDGGYIHFSEENFPQVQETKPTKDYAQIYNDLEPANFSYLHNIDPDQYYDMKDTAWSIYPLFRLNSPIYFKNITIEPGYYLITPREHEGKWYILFKQNGIVMHIIPVYDRDYTPEMFYDKHIPKPKLTKAQKVHMGLLDFIGHFKSTKRKEPVQTYLEVNDLDNYFVSIVIYYGGHKYSTLFRTIRL